MKPADFLRHTHAPIPLPTHERDQLDAATRDATRKVRRRP
jgi:hypothetical protein